MAYDMYSEYNQKNYNKRWWYKPYKSKHFQNDLIIKHKIDKFIQNAQFSGSNRMATEVLDEEEYTKAADVYSFAIIASDIISDFQPYSDVPMMKS
ncbi:hypothetical protein Glove_320g161 [Diversispora epigaea]|uniref:Uncharacterized protein n=1 Tax=Diversispora epigaea TaxID=1348612 RepID=A0A397HTE2_9GLOM|nr:hypothetical protein Glove_320g161 [Diversispora epigaea]